MEDKFTRERVQAILEDIQDYVPLEVAAKKNGISYERFRQWRIRGEEHLHNYVESDYAFMVVALNQIYALQIKENMDKIRFCPKGHRGAEWSMEKRFPRFYTSRAEVIDVHERIDELKDQDAKREFIDVDTKLKKTQATN